MVNNTIKIAPEHLPRGTIFTTRLYKRSSNGQLSIVWNPHTDDEPVQFTVDHILLVESFSVSPNYLIVTTEPNPKESVFSDENITFNVGHVDAVLKRGNEFVLKHGYVPSTKRSTWNTGNKYTAYELENMTTCVLWKLNHFGYFDFDNIFARAITCGLVREINSGTVDTKYRFGVNLYTVNRRKFKTWLKRNQNRFLISKKRMQEIQDRIDDQLYERMERMDDLVGPTGAGVPFGNQISISNQEFDTDAAVGFMSKYLDKNILNSLNQN